MQTAKIDTRVTQDTLADTKKKPLESTYVLINPSHRVLNWK